MQKSVSIVIPVYNVEEQIERCLHSLFRQTYPCIEYIFVDDCSPDKSTDIIKYVLEQYPGRKKQTTILSNTQDKGVAFTRNRGISEAHGDYIIQFDPDDWIESDMIEKLMFAVTTGNADIGICDFIFHRNRKLFIESAFLEGTSEEYAQAILEHKRSPSFCNKLISASLFKKYRISCPENLNREEDLFCTVQLCLHAPKIIFVQEPLYHYVYNPISITNQGNINCHWQRLQIHKKLKEILGTSLPERSWELNLLLIYADIISLEKDPRKAYNLLASVNFSHSERLRFSRVLLIFLLQKKLFTVFRIVRAGLEIARKMRICIWVHQSKKGL